MKDAMALHTEKLEHSDAHEDGEHVVDSWLLYAAVFGALLFLTIVTVAASYVDFGGANTVIAVLIASTKAALVAIFFMHLRHDKPFHALVLLSGLLFLSFLFLFTLTDEGTRNDVDDFNGKPVEAPPATIQPQPGPAPSMHGMPPAHH